MNSNHDNYSSLCRLLEAMAGRSMRTPLDFEFLRDSIYGQTHETIGLSTLKRLFGYVKSDSEPRRSTLDILCQYAGYMGWEDFCKRETAGEKSESNAFIAETLDSSDLASDACIIVIWNPDRRCVFRHLQGDRFMVVESINSKLSPGDTFRCPFFINGEPLYLNELSMNGAPPVNYVCGRLGGIRYFL